jgi:hypothetical protein
MRALERLVPRMTIGSWSSARSQLTLAAAAIHTLTAAVSSNPQNASLFMELAPLKPLIRALSLPANEQVTTRAMECIQALCSGHRASCLQLCTHGGVAALVHILQGAQGGLSSGHDDFVEVAVRTLTCAVDGIPECQAEACKGDPWNLFCA